MEHILHINFAVRPLEEVGPMCMVPPCPGPVYRCRVSRYHRPRTGAYTHTVEFRPLKRLSCPGCDSCEGLHEFICESDGMFDYPPNPVDGALYRLKVTAMSYEYDIDAYSVEVVGFVPIEEESPINPDTKA